MGPGYDTVNSKHTHTHTHTHTHSSFIHSFTLPQILFLISVPSQWNCRSCWASQPTVLKCDVPQGSVLGPLRHAKLLLRSLHRLPVRARIKYNTPTLCYRSRHSSAPTRSLRSADAGLMTVPRIKLSKYGKRSFSDIGTATWYSLPKPLHKVPSLSSFKSSLKTFLFKRICTMYIHSQIHQGVGQS